jgi:hypothetical protein
LWVDRGVKYSFIVTKQAMDLKAIMMMMEGRSYLLLGLTD